MRKHRPVITMQPKLDYMDVKRAYFIHKGAVYPVATAPSYISSKNAYNEKTLEKCTDIRGIVPREIRAWGPRT